MKADEEPGKEEMGKAEHPECEVKKGMQWGGKRLGDKVSIKGQGVVDGD